MDRIVADPELNIVFVATCKQLGLGVGACELNHAIFNFRKSGELSIKTTKRTRLDTEELEFAAQVAIRLIARRDGITLDDVLCDPVRAADFDQLAKSITPGFSSLHYRWAALRIRKIRELVPEVAARILRPEEARLLKLTGLTAIEIPRQPGVYVFLDQDSKETIYVGEAANLRKRLGTHVEHSDNKLLARHLWQNGPDKILIEYYVLPNGTSKRELRAIEGEQIRLRRPTFNIAGIV